jgi:hypothetical protein
MLMCEIWVISSLIVELELGLLSVLLITLCGAWVELFLWPCVRWAKRVFLSLWPSMCNSGEFLTEL